MKTKLTIFTSLLVFASFSLSALAATPTPTATPKDTKTVVENAVAAATNSTTTERVKWVNDKLQAALADLITKSVSVAGDAKDFVVGELPDIIKQLLLWKLFESFVPMVFWFCSFWFFAILFMRTTIKNEDWKCNNTNRYNDYPQNGFPKAWIGVFKVVACLVSVICFLFSMNLTWLQIWLAPKVYLIEYSKSMLEGIIGK